MTVQHGNFKDTNIMTFTAVLRSKTVPLNILPTYKFCNSSNYGSP